MLSFERQEKYDQLLKAIGDIRLYRIHKVPVPNNNQIFAIEEWLNPTGSIFDRLYPHLFKIAEQEKIIVPGITPVVEVSTGNAGASFAWCAANLGYTDCTVIIHEDAPKYRIEQIRSYGAKIIYSPAGQYAKGYVKKLEEILAEDKRKKGGRIGENPKRLFCVSKINPHSREVYYKLIDNVLNKLNGIVIDYFIGVVGSGNSVSGAGRRLKENNKNTKIIVIEPRQTPTLYTLKFQKKMVDFPCMPHEIFGIAPFGLPPEKFNIDLEIIDEIRLIDKDIWKDGCSLLSKSEKKPVGRSSGAVFMSCLEVAKKVKGKNILMIFYDPIWKYDDTYPFLK